jgi:uncharacterized protein (DUF1501 family)
MACYDRSEITRRQLVGRSIGFGLTVYGGAKLLSADALVQSAQAQAAAAPADAPVLVSVFLPGGCDLLSALPPVEQLGLLNDLRATLPPGDVPGLPGESRLGMHPGFTDGTGGGIAGLYSAGKIGFLPGIDYAPPDLSHFHSRHFWERGMVTQDAGAGWLGRWLDRHGNGENPLQGLTMSSTLSPVLATGGAPVAALNNPDDAALQFGGTWGTGADKAAEAWARLAAVPRRGVQPQAASHIAALTQSVGTMLAPYKSDKKTNSYPLAPPVAYPTGSDFAKRLSSLAGLIAQPLGIRVATINAPGDYDTHDNQTTDLTKALGELSRSLSAFQADLEARGVADRVLTFVWSEFGRRPQSNRSAGTDHGAGGIAWVQGTRAASGILTDFPDLGALDRDDNLAVTVDFRRVYASLLEQWLGTDATEILPDAAAAGRVQLVRS